MRRLPVLFVALVAVAVSAYSKPKTTASAPPEKETPVPSIDACSLLSDAEIQSVQGEKPQERKPTAPPGGPYRVSQCYFALPTHANSIVVTLTQRGTDATAKNPTKSWKEIFHREREKEEGKKGREREEEEENRPQPMQIKGIGDEAFWDGNKVAGAIYVLKGNAYVRISTGGPDPLEKCKRLAQAALSHL